MNTTLGHPDDFSDDGCQYSFAKLWCDTHNRDCDLEPVRVCPGCGAQFRYAHKQCSALDNPVTLAPGDHMQITYTLTDDTRIHSMGSVSSSAVSSSAVSSTVYIVQDTFQRADGSVGNGGWTTLSGVQVTQNSAGKWGPTGNDGWYTTQTVLPNTASVEQRQELLRALREDPSMGQRNTRQFVASIDRKRITTAASFDAALDIGTWPKIMMGERQQNFMGGPGETLTLETLPDDQWVHMIIKPTRPNDLGILALKRSGRFLQVHEVVSGGRANSEFPGIDRVFIFPPR